MFGGEPAALSSHLEQTLEDEYLELEPAQVRAALQQAGGCLQVARTLCAHLASQQQTGCPAAAAPLPASTGPARLPQQQQQRQWWPLSEFSGSGGAVASSARPSGRPSSSSSPASSTSQRPRLVPHQVLPLPAQPSTQQQQREQQAMKPATAAYAQRAPPPTNGSQHSPAALAIRRLLGSPAAGSGPGPSRSAQQASGTSRDGIAAASAGAEASSAPTPAPPTPAAGFPPARPTQRSPPQQQQQEEPPLHPHYAAVFLTEKSRRQLLQHVPPLHEQVSADHMTLAYKPSLGACMQLPLGRDAALFVVGAAADYRAQAVAVQHPSWVPFLSESTPHITVSVAEGVPAKEAGDLVAAALASGRVAPAARLKLLQGTVGVQLSDGSRVFSAEDLQAALAAAAQRQRAAAAPAGPLKILPRGAAPPAASAAPAAPAASTREAQPPETATEPAAPAGAPASAASSSGGGAAGAAKPAAKATAWDLDALLDQLHMAEQPSVGHAAPALPAMQQTEQAQRAQQAPPRRGLLKLPTAVAAEMAAPAGSAAAPSAAPAAVLTISRSQRRGNSLQQQQQQQQQRHHQQPPRQRAAASSDGTEWAEPEAPAPVFGKTAAEEAAEAAAGEEPLDLVSSLAHLLPGGSTAGSAAAAAPPEPPLPSPAVLHGLGVSATASSGGEAGPSGYETSSSSGSAVPGDEGRRGGGGGGGAAAPLDPESQHLLQLQFPKLHHLVVDSALRMHDGSLPAAAQFLAVLDHQQEQLGLGAGTVASGERRGPQNPTLGSFLQGVLPEAAEPAVPSYGSPPGSGAAGCFAGVAVDWADGWQGRGQAAPAAEQRGGSVGAGAWPGRGWQQQQQQGGAGGGRSRVKARRSTAGDDPMSVTERQAMNLHLSAKRLYTQAAQEAFSSGQIGLGKELQATARSHAEAASAARRRANASAFRSTNTSVMNTFTLDLHGQHVDEALASLERYLLTLGGLGHPGGVLLQVITGVGRHSHGNQPRILPAVVRYLSDAGYKFDSDETNPGVILVSIGV